MVQPQTDGLFFDEIRRRSFGTVERGVSGPSPRTARAPANRVFPHGSIARQEDYDGVRRALSDRGMERRSKWEDVSRAPRGLPPTSAHSRNKPARGNSVDEVHTAQISTLDHTNVP